MFPVKALNIEVFLVEMASTSFQTPLIYSSFKPVLLTGLGFIDQTMIGNLD